MKWKVGDTTITKLEEIVYPEFPDVIPGRNAGRGQEGEMAVPTLRDR